jgi:hypothetical protein
MAEKFSRSIPGEFGATSEVRGEVGLMTVAGMESCESVGELGAWDMSAGSQEWLASLWLTLALTWYLRLPGRLLAVMAESSAYSLRMSAEVSSEKSPIPTEDAPKITRLSASGELPMIWLIGIPVEEEMMNAASSVMARGVDPDWSLSMCAAARARW